MYFRTVDFPVYVNILFALGPWMFLFHNISQAYDSLVTELD